jgi:hypothetical protein
MECQKIESGFTRRPPGSQRFALLACEVLYREVCALLPTCPHTVDVVWLSQGLHDLGGEKMAAEIQRAIDALPAGRYAAVLLGFALCNNGVVGLTCPHAPLVIPKAHDCIALFLGCRQRYREYFDAHPGTFYLTTGWMERDDSRPSGAEDQTHQHQMGLDLSWDEMVQQYGEENARFLRETLGDLTAHYSRLAYITMPYDAALGFAAEARQAAAEKGWEFERLEGDLGLLARLLNGQWDGDMAVVQPGQTVAPTYDADVLCARCVARPAPAPAAVPQ